jgi:hypothetical protein
MLDPETIVTQWRVLLWSDGSAWEDEDAAVEDTAAAIRAEYLEPNGIYAEKIGQLGCGTWWVKACPKRTRLSDFYAAGEAGADGNLVWHTFYTFTRADGSDCISQGFDYIPGATLQALVATTKA